MKAAAGLHRAYFNLGKERRVVLVLFQQHTDRLKFANEWLCCSNFLPGSGAEGSQMTRTPDKGVDGDGEKGGGGGANKTKK